MTLSKEAVQFLTLDWKECIEGFGGVHSVSSENLKPEIPGLTWIDRDAAPKGDDCEWWACERFIAVWDSKEAHVAAWHAAGLPVKNPKSKAGGLLDWLDAAGVDTDDVASVVCNDDSEISVYHVAGPVVHIELVEGKMTWCRLTSCLGSREPIASPAELRSTLATLREDYTKEVSDTPRRRRGALRKVVT